MHIVFQIFSFNTGGIERQLIDMCNSMADLNHEITLCVINNDYTDSLLKQINEKVEIILLNRSKTDDKLSLLRYSLSFARWARRNHTDILHCQGINCVLFSGIAKILHPSMKILNTVHDSGNYSSYPSTKIWLQNRFCSKTIAISNSVRNEILTRNIRSENVVTIYNAIDTARFINSHTKENSSINSNSLQLVNVARFMPSKKGQDTLVYAVEQLLNKNSERFENLHCSFAGEIVQGQESAYYELENYVAEHNLITHISFLGNVEDVPSLLDSANIFILPSNYEGFGISLIEAMANGLPCVASNLQGPAEIFANAMNAGIYPGELSTPGDASSLATAISRVLSRLDSGLFDSDALSNYTRYTYSMSELVNKHLNLYSTLKNKL